MSEIAIEHVFDDVPENYEYSVSYDPDVTNIGSGMVQLEDELGKWVGPQPLASYAAGFYSGAIPAKVIFALKYNSYIDYIFTASYNTSALRRPIGLFKFNRNTLKYSFVGRVNLTFTSNTAVINGISANVVTSSAGTVSVSGTSVTGTNTFFQTHRISTGARIGFGSTNPNSITTWYEISSISSNTGITLNSSAGTMSNVSYVIEEIQIFLGISGVNPGIHIVKGIHEGVFSLSSGTVINYVTTDNTRGMVALVDNSSSISNLMGLSVDSFENYTTQYGYCINNLGQIWQFNLRASLTINVNGVSTSAYISNTANPNLNIVWHDCMAIATTNHGVGKNDKSLYFVASSRVYRFSLKNIISPSAFYVDAMIEILPYNSLSYNISSPGSLISIVYDSFSDYFYLGGASKFYRTKFKTEAKYMDLAFGLNDNILDNQNVLEEYVPKFQVASYSPSTVVDGIIYYLYCHTATTTDNVLYAISTKGNYDIGNNSVIITPKLSTPNCLSYNCVYFNDRCLLGGNIFGTSTELIELYYRTEGIDNNSGNWTLVKYGDLSDIQPSNFIQFMLKFKIFGSFCVPARVYSLGLTYKDNEDDPLFCKFFYKGNVKDQYYWKFLNSYNGILPNLEIIIYDTGSSNIILKDNSVAPNGNFDYSINGGTSWTTWSASNLNANSIIVRYTPLNLPNNLNVAASLLKY